MNEPIVLRLVSQLEKKDYDAKGWDFIIKEHLPLLLSRTHEEEEPILEVDKCHYIKRYKFINEVIYLHSQNISFTLITKVCRYVKPGYKQPNESKED